ncbi:hypothetical protein MN608_10144 [Microdochium nivale]|nr:hypothetical protein MN608_10144 [Microdochium nivale]
MDGLWKRAAGHAGHDRATTVEPPNQTIGKDQEDAKQLIIIIKLSVDATAYLPDGSKLLIPSSSTIFCPERTIISPIGVACDLVFEGNTMCDLTSPGSVCLAGTGITMRRTEHNVRLSCARYLEPERLPAGTILKVDNKMDVHLMDVCVKSVLKCDHVLKGSIYTAKARLILSHPIVLGSAGLKLSRNTTLSQNMVLAGDMLLGNETILPAAAEFPDTSPGFSVLDHNGTRTIQYQTDIMPKGATLPALTILPVGTVLAAGTVIPGCTTLPVGTVIHGSWIPAGTVLPAGIKIPAGVRLASDDYEYLQPQEMRGNKS